jgi:HPt (histidine-containing phosphotransfer) domain-containing protein
LSQFVVRQESTGNRIKEALEAADHDQAQRLAHSLKGVAGNLGINRIFVLAGNLENAIRESHVGTQGLIEDLTSALERQIRIIRAVLLPDSADAGKRFDARPAERGEALAAIGPAKGAARSERRGRPSSVCRGGRNSAGYGCRFAA